MSPGECLALAPSDERAINELANPWAHQICAAWHASREKIIECGRLLIEAKASLPHGAFERMVERDLPFNPSTAQRLMKIARDPRLTNPAHVQHLPP